MLRFPITSLVLVACAVGFMPGLSAAQGPPSEEFVRDVTEKVLMELRKDDGEMRKDSKALYDLADRLVLPHFDFERMSQRVLGKHWRSAGSDQRRRFIEEFRTLLVRTYAVAVAQYSEQEIRILTTRERKNGKEASVRTEVVQPGGPSIPIRYDLHDMQGGWKVYDVTIDGVSLVINYRSTFNREIGRNGIDALIERLEKRNAEQSTG